MLIHHTLSPGEEINILRSGQEFFSVLEQMIDKAEKEIHFQVYIFDKDETGTAIMNALLRAAARGVKVFLVIDRYGSLLLPSVTIDRLLKAGISIKLYGPLIRHWRFHIGRRLHRKIFVFDEKAAIVTGMNISNNYNDINDKKAWLDFACVVKGPVVAGLHVRCLQIWMKKSFRKTVINRWRQLRRIPLGSQFIRIRQNDWSRGLNEINATYRHEISHARESLFLVGAYFLPGGRLRRMLKRASDRGVKIQLLVAEKSDVDLMRGATLYLYRWMLRNKISVHEFRASNVHGKLLIADREMISMGSYDLNNLSTYSNIELNLNIYHPEVAAAFQNELQQIANNECRLITEEDLSKRDTHWKMFRHWVAYQLVKSLFSLSVKLAKREKEES